MAKARIVVIGSGIAGLSTAAAASENFEITVVEAEIQGGYHSSGRSATIFQKNFETGLISRMSVISENFFLNPANGYEQVAAPLHRLLVANSEEKHLLDAYLTRWSDSLPWLRVISNQEIAERFPILNNDYAHAILDDDCLNLDIHNLLDGHRRKIRTNGGVVLNNYRLTDIQMQGREWQLRFANGELLTADIVVNAAGAWADQIAELAGVQKIGIQPKRRTALLIDPNQDSRNWSTIYKLTNDLYIKPEGSLLMVSPMDEHDSPPTDAQPEMMDVAITVERFEELTTMSVERPTRTWAGLRSFVSDRNPVIGYGNPERNFFWVAAFGGSGILTSPCYSEVAANLLQDRTVPEHWNIDPNELSPDRLQDD